MKKVLLPVADGFEEIETMTIVDILRRAEVDVTLAGVRVGELTGSRGVKLVPDVTLASVKDEEFDMLILPGGQPGVDNLKSTVDVITLLQEAKEKGKLIGAICAAPMILKEAGLSRDLNFTCYPGCEPVIDDGKFSEDRVVVDGNIITSRGPGTAMEFSLKLVELLCGKAKADEIQDQVLALSPIH